jgi:DNA repair exonuclease SbcCD nuclease subunit
MKQLLIGDCHFGTSSNSIVWLENQLKFFHTQFIEVLDSREIDRIVFLGDLTDIRYSINQQVGIELKNLIRKLLNKYSNKEFFFIAGNHDYYSPLEEFHEYNSYELMFGEEFVQAHPNMKIINNEPYYDNCGNLYLPWYYTENFQHFSDLLYSINVKELKNIFCHDDLVKWDYSRTSLFSNAKVWSGHIHTARTFDNPNLIQIGSMFSFNFSDVNTIKHMYLIDDDGLVEKIENKVSPRFKRFFNDEIFNLTAEDFENSYVQICIFKTNINQLKYIERIKEIKSNYAQYNLRIQIIDNSLGETLELSYFNANIDNYINENIPDYLTNKYEIVKDKIQNKNEIEQ